MNLEVIKYVVSPQISSKALNELFASAWGEHTPTDWNKLLKHSLFYICAYDEDKLVGFVKLISDGGIHGFLLDTSVHADYKKQGIGSELVKQCLNLAKEKNITWIHVDYEEHLDSFYKACGFRDTKAALVNLIEGI